MSFINATEIFGVILSSGTVNVTGSIIATLFLILLFLLIIAIMFGIPFEFTAILILPFCLAVGAYYGNFIIPVTIISIYLSALIAKNWLFR